MKKTLALTAAVLYLSCLGCRYDDSTLESSKYSEYEPILADRTTLDKIAFTGAIPIVNTGKIYSYGNYILINELDKGYHIIDNSNLTNPVNVGFLSILASQDVAVRNGILYSNSATDLISVDVSDITHPKVISRTENVFPQQNPPDDLPVHPDYVVNNRPANTVIIEWRKRQ